MSIVVSNRNFIIHNKEEKLVDDTMKDFEVHYEKKPTVKPKEKKVLEKKVEKKKTNYFIPSFYI